MDCSDLAKLWRFVGLAKIQLILEGTLFAMSWRERLFAVIVLSKGVHLRELVSFIVKYLVDFRKFNKIESLVKCGLHVLLG